ncbi:UNVERIFIED_CONTAM: hypothetical protein RMT77_017453 [Armadillidium vulgare]
MDKDGMNIADQEPCCYSENDENRVKGGTSKVAGSRPSSHMGMRTRSLEEEEGQSQHSMKSYPPLSAATSSTSIATDVTMATTTPLGDALERKIEALLRDWLGTADMIFSIHPVDGSLLMWMVDFLDGTQGAFRQAQVSFCARLPSALPLGDAMTMAPNLAIYNGSTPSIVKMLIKLESLSQEEEKGKRKTKSNWTLSSNGEEELWSWKGGQGITGPSPIICLTTKHSNGSLNLWHLTVAEGSRFTQVLNISHFTRVCGHRFHLNDIMCHPVLPLLLTTSHHNKSQTSPCNPPSTTVSEEAPLICIQDTPFKDWCSELILWRVDAVGPLSKSGGVTELARINSPQVSAFSNVAWIPTLLPSTTLGRVSNSPSACFVASDGECLRVYQAVIDGRVLLAEISTAERKKRVMEQTISLSTDSSLQEHVGQVNLMDIFNIVSEQSTARPGCIIQLDAILDATNDWQNTQFLHVFQEALILGEKYSKKQTDSIVETEPSAIVDLHSKTAFEEPFYVTLLEKTQKGSVMHMWRLVISSQHHEEFHEAQDTLPPPDDMRNFKNVGMEPKGFSVEASPIIISTSKIYCSPLPLPAGVEIVHSCPAAGHLSSASIYPACFAPYVLVTACSDNMVRFWRCRINGGGSETKELKIEWQEWSMISKERKSAIKIPGEVLHVNAAYSGRIAVAYQRSPSEKCVTLSSNGSLVFSCMVSVYECESTGGSEWILRDTIELKDVIVNQENNLSQEIDFACHSHLSQGKSVTKLASALSNEDLTLVQPSQPLNHIDHLASDALQSISSQMSVPSASTLKSLRCQRHENSSVNLKQKHPIQLDWLSMENGSHLLTVAIGSKILVYTCISEDVQHINVLEGSFKPETRPRPVLQKSVSMHQLSLDVLPRWMRLDKFSLATADGLSPLPMRISWVRDGILIIGMDNEMQICTQWHENDVSGEEQHHEDTFCEVMKNRDLTQHQLMNVLKDSSSHHPKSVTSMSRITSYSVLSSLDNKMKKGLGEVIENPIEEIDEMSCAGIYELSHLVSPVLPQYHPKQLMELLNSGKIRRVKAILAHLLRCLMILGQRSVSDNVNRSSVSEGDHDTKKSWSRSRTLSITAGPSAGGREGRNSITVRPEELTLDYVEIKAIPPLPLWLLLEADKERTQAQLNISEKKQETYAELFEITTTIADDSDDLNLDDEEPDINTRRKSLTQDNKNISFFGPRQAQYISGLLTHTHLPGLSSLDQMHLLALADTVASCNVDFADKFDINRDREAMAKEVYNRSAADEPSMDSLDDCGLRFLLAMRQHTYLLRCLPIGQRAQLQKAGIGCHNIVWAFHSESHDELLDFIPAVRQGNIRWAELRELGVGWWVRSNTVLTKIMLKVAKAAFQVRNDPLDAAIYYLAMQKKSLVWGLFRSINDGRMTDFFANNFTVERWRKAALKNAFALMGKQRFEHAAAFFLLAGALKDAVEVVLTKLNDEQLAFVITRLYEGELVTTPPTLQKLLYTRFLGCDENGSNQEIQNCHPDPFLRSMSYWLTGKYNDSLNTLLISDPAMGCDHSEYKGEKVQHTQKDISSVDPTVFNFYIYLRTHPLLIRQCIANTAKDTSRTLMASRLGAGHDTMDKKALYESSMTPQERCLYFTTAHAHLFSGCPTLALEVLSKLPLNVIDLDNPDSGDLLGSPVKEKKPGLDLIKSGTLDDGGSFDLGLAKGDSSKGLDWSLPAYSLGGVQEELKLELDFSPDEDDEFSDEEKAKDDNPSSESSSDESVGGRKHLDIMAQQLKFICCLKMMMEELATLATGCEVDGGQLRYQLYIWLEREVEALKEICSYRSTLPTSGADLVGINPEEEDYMRTPSPAPPYDQPATLHEILQQENIEFEYKRKRAIIRKRWLNSNQQLLRTLLCYCSLHGSSGGGLASVRMELILLLQELQQENNKQQLLSPLPLPTTLPLLSASIASNKTVVADPVRHLQCATHDLLQTLVEISSLSTPDVTLMKLSITLRNLAASLSACIYQSVCDSENISLKTQPRVAALGLDLQHVSVAHKESHLIGRESRSTLPDEEQLQVSTTPSKWPGVSSLLALITHERDEDSPKLNILLCEAFVSVYLCLLIHGIASSDAYVLYRLVSVDFKEKDWGLLFGGGVKRIVKIITNAQPTPSPAEKETGAAVSGERILSTITNLQKTRIKLNMKFLGQLGFQDPRASCNEGDTKTGTREHFCPPELSIVSYLMTKPSTGPDLDAIDYDSSASDVEEEELEFEEDEDVFKEPKIYPENAEHCNTDSYSWCLLRLACVKRAQCVVTQFLKVAEVDLQELAVQSPLLYSVLHTLEIWINSLVSYLEEKKGPPPEYIPGCFAQSSVNGPAILKYKALLETHNTPFARNKRGVKPVNRLWNCLMRQEEVQEYFVRYIFGRKRPLEPPSQYTETGVEEEGSDSGDIIDGELSSEPGLESQQEPSEGGGGGSDSSTPTLEAVKIIHKDQDSITAFCMNKINNGLVAVATMKEVQEIDISLLLKHPSWLTNECELDVLGLNLDPDTFEHSNFLVVQTPYDKALLEARGDGSYSTMNSGSPQSQTGRGTNVLKDLKGGGGNYPGANNPRFNQFVWERSKHYLKPVLTYKMDGSRRMTPHPNMSSYLVGCQDGSVVVREWKHNQVVSQPRPGGTFAKVTRLRFNQQGNKFGVIDGDGHLSLYHLGASTNNKSFYTHHCHNKHGHDFTFVGSSSLLATAGQSSDHRNVAIWDTLMPQRKANVVSWTCHESGASAILYAPQHQVIISAGKKGQVCLFDVRQRIFRHKFQAHDSSIKCMALDINEDFFITGSSDGDIKVWGLSVHNLVYNLPGEHSRTSLFKNLSQGVTNLYLDSCNRLFSCGADGSVKMRILPDKDWSINTL